MSSVNITGFEREKKVTFTTKAPTGALAKSVMQRTQERASFDSIFEPKRNTSNCTNLCICIDCLEKACCELDKIQSKLPYLEFIKKNKDEQSSGVAISAARMMSKILALHEQGKKLKLVSKKVKDKSRSKKEHKSKDFLLKRSASREQRLTTVSDTREDEEFNVLTNEKEDSLKWRLRQVGADIP
jgi:hypothetical protein